MAQLQLFSSLYDLADTSYRYGVYGEAVNAHRYLKTSGSSATVSELNTTDNTFAGFGLGDLLHVNVDGDVTTRLLTAVGSIPDSVTVSSAVDWQNGTAGRAFSYRKWNNGTTSADGWFRVAQFDRKAIEFEWVTKNATSADVSIEGRITGGGAAVLYTKNYTAVAAEIFGDELLLPLCDEMRVGIKINTDAGVNNFKATFIGDGGRIRNW